ncbi:uncharacterized protein LOC134536465 [Bacillus rossius redtenbacheri]|uniref:uncharacterized protein LOC134536465 n=1 Tax=Bacillus rossius redtenbacheri TaxID=93214 RepID=UPI002FDE984F
MTDQLSDEQVMQECIDVPLPSDDEQEMSSDDGFTTVVSKKQKTGGKDERLRPPLTNPAIARQQAERLRKQPVRRANNSASQTAANTSAGSSPAPPNPAPQAKKMQVKPLYVFVDSGHSYPAIKRVLDAALQERWSCVSRGHDQLMIHTATVEEYHRAVRALEQAGVQHSVLLQRDEIPKKFVFCRVHSSTDKQFIQAEFAAMGLPVQNFWFLYNRQTRAQQQQWQCGHSPVALSNGESAKHNAKQRSRRRSREPQCCREPPAERSSNSGSAGTRSRAPAAVTGVPWA